MLAPVERKRKEELKRKAAEKKDELKRSGSDAAILQNISEDAPNTELGKSQHETCLHLVRSSGEGPAQVLRFSLRGGHGGHCRSHRKIQSANLGGFCGPRRFDLGARSFPRSPTRSS